MAQRHPTKIETPTNHQIFTVLQAGHPIYVQKGGHVIYNREKGKYIYHPNSRYEPEQEFDSLAAITIWLAFDESHYFPSILRDNNATGSTINSK